MVINISFPVVGREAVCALPSGDKIIGEGNIAKYLVALLGGETTIENEKIDAVLDRCHADLVWGADPSGFLNDIDKSLAKV